MENYQLSLVYEDGTKGVANLSHLVNKGVFTFWHDYKNFCKVYIDQDSNALAWNDEIDICPDSLYLKIKNLSFNNWKEQQYASN